MTNELYRWVHIAVIGRMLGVASPRHRLKQAMRRGEVKQIGRGHYQIDRKRVRQRYQRRRQARIV